MAQYTELDMDQGADVSYDINLTEDDGSPINCASYTFSSSMRKSYFSLRPTANLTVTIIDAANGNVSIGLTAAQTANIKPGRYLYDVKQTDNVGQKTRIVEGIITVNPQVTK